MLRLFSIRICSLINLRDFFLYNPALTPLLVCPLLLPYFHLHLQEYVPHTTSTGPPYFLGPQNASYFGISFLMDVRRSIHLLCVFWGPQIRYYVVWLVAECLTDLSSQVSGDCWSSHGTNLFLNFFQLFLNFTTGIPGFCPLVGCYYLHLTLAAVLLDP